MKKKFVVLALLLCALACSVPVHAASRATEIEKLALSLDNTQEAVCLTFGSYCVLGVRTKGIFLKSESVAYVAKLKDGVKKMCPDLQFVYVATELKEMLAVKEARRLSDEGKSPVEIFKAIKKKYPDVLDKMIAQNYNTGS